MTTIIKPIGYGHVEQRRNAPSPIDYMWCVCVLHSKVGKGGAKMVKAGTKGVLKAAKKGVSTSSSGHSSPSFASRVADPSAGYVPPPQAAICTAQGSCASLSHMRGIEAADPRRWATLGTAERFARVHYKNRGRRQGLSRVA